MAKTYLGLPDAPSFADVEPLANQFMSDYEGGAYNAVQVVYMKFISTARQQAQTVKLLPIEAVKAERADDDERERRTDEVQYDFSPPPAELLAELLPVTVRVRLYQCFLDATVSENVARMVAMKAATDSANEMTKMLGQQFNRARQSQITMELLDIIGGVEALK